MTAALVPDVMIDRTHMRRRHSGIERITDKLFPPSALAPLRIGAMEAPGHRAGMLFRQMISNPLTAARMRSSVWIFPGYPPSPLVVLMRERTVLYVHDLFLLTRKQDLNWAARFYMAHSFRWAITRLRYFLANSETTKRQLAQKVSKDARIELYRPRVDNVFQLRVGSKEQKANGTLIVGALGTIEPRKNFLASARICEALSNVMRRPVELHIIGRAGWGSDFQQLSTTPNVRLHGSLADGAARRVIENFDLFLCTSHDEGLGLPLLEMQYAGLPVVAPDQDIFHEVLGPSGTYITPATPERAAATIEVLLQNRDWRSAAASQARTNLERWNKQADQDRSTVIAFLSEISARLRCQQS